VILVGLGGGAATIDMWDMKPDAPDTIRGDFKPIETSAAGIRICEHLPKMARLMDRCALVRSVHHGLPVHGPGTAYMVTGNRPSPALEYPALGALAATLLRGQAGVPSSIPFQQVETDGGGYLGPLCNPFQVAGDGKAGLKGLALPDGFTAEELEARDRLRRTFDARFKALDE